MTLTREQIEALLDGATKGPWRAGKAFQSIVADGPTGHDDPEAQKAYGGSLVCESVSMTGNRAIIEAAPDLAKTALDALDALAAERQARIDAEAAATLVVERAAKAAYCCAYDVPDNVTYDEGQMFRAGAETAKDAVAAALRNLAPTSGLTMLAELRAERDEYKRLAIAGNIVALEMRTVEADRDRLAAENAATQAKLARVVEASISVGKWIAKNLPADEAIDPLLHDLDATIEGAKP